MASNGKLLQSELAPIPGGQLRKDAAAAWNAPGGPADAGLRPTGSRSSYRLFVDQQYFWNNQPPLAAYPGTSNHGWGIAVDLAEPWMRDWVDEHGAKYGWRKTEAFSEWWHVNFVGGVSFPTFVVLHRNSKGKRVRYYTKRLAFIHERGGGPYLGSWRWRYDERVVRGVREFQHDFGLGVDGKIGPKTGAKIQGVFKHQYRQRKRKR